MDLVALDLAPGLWLLRGATNGYLIVRDGRSLLIDCPAGDVAGALRSAGLPLPERILHTQVQAEHCHESTSLPGVPVQVAAAAVEVARRSEAYFAACQTLWPPDRYWGSLGEETYGVAGCTTEREPAVALALDPAAPSFELGEALTWADVALTVLPLPGHGKRSVGLHWAAAGLVFSGDLLEAGGFLVNFYDLERAYGPLLGYKELRESLDRVLELAPRALLPTSGAPILEPAADIAALRGRLKWLRQPPMARGSDPRALCSFEPIREFGRYREALPGVFQNTNFGNVVLFVRPDGGGLMVDPDFCVWESWEENCRQWEADLDLLERETGLKRIERVLLTHYHGDHVQYADLVRQRYGAPVCATPDVAAVTERAKEFRYPCTIDWYNFPFDHVKVDELMPYDVPFMWHDMAITPLHTPGHCNAHASFLTEWGGKRLVVAGDVIQYGGGPITCPLPIMYNDNAWPARGLMATLDALAPHRLDYLLCGHSHAYAFTGPDDALIADWQAVSAESLALARGMVADGDVQGRMTPPHFDALRPSRGV